MEISHIRSDGVEKPLEEHLHEVAERARCFADKFNAGDWAYITALLHDLGKFSDDFQKYIRRPDDKKHRGEVNHSSPGAIWAVEKQKDFGWICAFLIAGHHAGLPDSDSDSRRCLTQRLLNDKDWFEKTMANPNAQKFAEGLPELTNCIPPQLPKEIQFSLWIRMLFSCLVDADFLATEAFLEPDKSGVRGHYPSITTLKGKFDSHIKEISDNAPDTEINQIRRKIQTECANAGKQNNAGGIYSLTVPTGGGKTLASMQFALEHAVKHNKERIIYVIPFTSIIEQTVNVYRGIFGQEAVVEHHSNMQHEAEKDSEDLQSSSYRQRLACENWDAPIVVTTNVQLLESLFAAKTSRCRKLHNIINSVIILDEAQTLPLPYLKPILSAIKELVESYKVTVVLCTATQPAVDLDLLNVELKPQEICSDPDGLAQKLDRVNIHVPKDINTPLELDDLANELMQHEQVLCIVNTRKSCLELYKKLAEGTNDELSNMHLSTFMCGQHRMDKIQFMRQQLEEKKPIRVVSTSLIEAGVDVDFPVVYRAGIGLDSIAQAAGRCNREGHLENGGDVHVFVPDKEPPKGVMLKGWSFAKNYMQQGEMSLKPSTLKSYFAQLYQSANSLDKKQIIEKLSLPNALFRTVGEEFRLIENAELSVVVPYGEGIELIAELSSVNELKRGLMRRLQRYTVNVRERQLQLMLDMDEIEIKHGLYVLCNANLYCKATGLKMRDEVFRADTAF